MSLDRYENRIERLEEEKANAKSALMDKRKELGGLNYLGSFFKFAKKVEPEKVKKEKVVVEKERVEEVKRKGLEKKRQKELEERKREEERAKKAKLRQEKRKTRGKKVFDFFHGRGLVKTEKEKKEYGRQKQKECITTLTNIPYFNLLILTMCRNNIISVLSTYNSFSIQHLGD